MAVIGLIGVVVANSGSSDSSNNTPPAVPSTTGSGASSSVSVTGQPVAHVTVVLSAPQEVNRVPLPTKLDGSVENLPPDYRIWFATRAHGEANFHPADTACKTNSGSLDCGQLYLGAPADHGKKFTVTFFTVQAGSAADKFLTTYGKRDKTTSNAYAGLPRLPSGTVTIHVVGMVRV